MVIERDPLFEGGLLFANRVGRWIGWGWATLGGGLLFAIRMSATTAGRGCVPGKLGGPHPRTLFTAVSNVTTTPLSRLHEPNLQCLSNRFLALQVASSVKQNTTDHDLRGRARGKNASGSCVDKLREKTLAAVENFEETLLDELWTQNMHFGALGSDPLFKRVLEQAKNTHLGAWLQRLAGCVLEEKLFRGFACEVDMGRDKWVNKRAKVI